MKQLCITFHFSSHLSPSQIILVANLSRVEEADKKDVILLYLRPRKQQHRSHLGNKKKMRQAMEGSGIVSSLAIGVRFDRFHAWNHRCYSTRKYTLFGFKEFIFVFGFTVFRASLKW